MNLVTGTELNSVTGTESNSVSDTDINVGTGTKRNFVPVPILIYSSGLFAIIYAILHHSYQLRG